jgi:hypothetical protein
MADRDELIAKVRAEIERLLALTKTLGVISF